MGSKSDSEPIYILLNLIAIANITASPTEEAPSMSLVLSEVGGGGLYIGST